jgi:hypothetical protein
MLVSCYRDAKERRLNEKATRRREAAASTNANMGTIKSRPRPMGAVPTRCDGIHTPCTYPTGTKGEVDATCFLP